MFPRGAGAYVLEHEVRDVVEEHLADLLREIDLPARLEHVRTHGAHDCLRAHLVHPAAGQLPREGEIEIRAPPDVVADAAGASAGVVRHVVEQFGWAGRDQVLGDGVVPSCRLPATETSS